MNNQNEPILQKHITQVLKETLKDYGCEIFVAKPHIADISADKYVVKVEVFLEFGRVEQNERKI